MSQPRSMKVPPHARAFLSSCDKPTVLRLYARNRGVAIDSAERSFRRLTKNQGIDRRTFFSFMSAGAVSLGLNKNWVPDSRRQLEFDQARAEVLAWNGDVQTWLRPAGGDPLFDLFVSMTGCQDAAQRVSFALLAGTAAYRMGQQGFQRLRSLGFSSMLKAAADNKLSGVPIPLGMAARHILARARFSDCVHEKNPIDACQVAREAAEEFSKCQPVPLNGVWVPTLQECETHIPEIPAPHWYAAATAHAYFGYCLELDQRREGILRPQGIKDWCVRAITSVRKGQQHTPDGILRRLGTEMSDATFVAVLHAYQVDDIALNIYGVKSRTKAIAHAMRGLDCVIAGAEEIERSSSDERTISKYQQWAIECELAKHICDPKFPDRALEMIDRYADRWENSPIRGTVANLMIDPVFRLAARTDPDICLALHKFFRRMMPGSVSWV